MKRFSIGSAFTLRGRMFQGLSGWDGKPLHPPLTDVSVGAYVIAPALDVIAFAGRSESWGRDLYMAASYTLLAGAIVSVFTALTGLADWLRMRAGSEVRRIANTHALIMVAVQGLVITNVLLRFTDDLDETTPALLVLSLAILTLVTVGGMIGGSLVFDKGYKIRMQRGSDSGDETPSERKAG